MFFVKSLLYVEIIYFIITLLLIQESLFSMYIFKPFFVEVYGFRHSKTNYSCPRPNFGHFFLIFPDISLLFNY